MVPTKCSKVTAHPVDRDWGCIITKSQHRQGRHRMLTSLKNFCPLRKTDVVSLQDELRTCSAQTHVLHDQCACLHLFCKVTGELLQVPKKCCQLWIWWLTSLHVFNQASQSDQAYLFISGCHYWHLGLWQMCQGLFLFQMKETPTQTDL